MSRLKLGKSCESAALRQKSPVAVSLKPAASTSWRKVALNTMQGLADGGALAGQRRMIGDDKNAARLERGEQFAIHLRAVDLHVGRVVVVEQGGDQVEVRHARWNRIVERSPRSAGFCANTIPLGATARAISSLE